MRHFVSGEYGGNGAVTVAPLLIGIVRSQSGWGAVIALGACGFGLSSLLIANLRTHANPTVSSNSGLADILEGFRTVGKDPLLTQLMLAAVLGYAMTGPLQILLPKLAREVLHLSELQRGAYLGLLALSLIVGGVTALAVAQRVRHGLVMFIGIALGGLVFASLSVIGAVGLSAAALASVGMRETVTPIWSGAKWRAALLSTLSTFQTIASAVSAPRGTSIMVPNL